MVKNFQLPSPDIRGQGRQIDCWGGQELVGVGAQTPPYTSPSSGNWAGSPGGEHMFSCFAPAKGKS